jgi:hypothetical protein
MNESKTWSDCELLKHEGVESPTMPMRRTYSITDNSSIYSMLFLLKLICKRHIYGTEKKMYTIKFAQAKKIKTWQ